MKRKMVTVILATLVSLTSVAPTVLASVESEEQSTPTELSTVNNEEISSVAELPAVDNEDLSCIAESPAIGKEVVSAITELPAVDNEESSSIEEVTDIENGTPSINVLGNKTTLDDYEHVPAYMRNFMPKSDDIIKGIQCYMYYNVDERRVEYQDYDGNVMAYWYIGLGPYHSDYKKIGRKDFVKGRIYKIVDDDNNFIGYFKYDSVEKACKESYYTTEYLNEKFIRVNEKGEAIFNILEKFKVNKKFFGFEFGDFLDDYKVFEWVNGDLITINNEKFVEEENDVTSSPTELGSNAPSENALGNKTTLDDYEHVPAYMRNFMPKSDDIIKGIQCYMYYNVDERRVEYQDYNGNVMAYWYLDSSSVCALSSEAYLYDFSFKKIGRKDYRKGRIYKITTDERSVIGLYKYDSHKEGVDEFGIEFIKEIFFPVNEKGDIISNSPLILKVTKSGEGFPNFLDDAMVFEWECGKIEYTSASETQD